MVVTNATPTPHYGLPRNFVREVTGALAPGTSALLALVREASVELAVVVDVRTETWRAAVGDHLELAADRVSRLADPVDLRDHP